MTRLEEFEAREAHILEEIANLKMELSLVMGAIKVGKKAEKLEKDLDDIAHDNGLSELC
jgi:hypothetical protein